MRVWRFSLCWLGALAGGCFDPTIPHESALLCTADINCPADRTCALGRCVPLEALKAGAPQVVDVVITPALAGRGSRVEVSFAVVGSLAGPPVVEGDVGRPVRLVLDNVSEAAGRSAFVFSYIVDGTESPGEAGFSATLLDRLGRGSTAPLGSVTIDVRAPTFLDPLVSRERASAGGVVALDVSLSEPAAVTGWAIAPDGATFPLDITVTDLEVHAPFVVDPGRPDGESLAIVLRAHDVAGNDSGEVELGEVIVDRLPPSVAWLEPDTSSQPDSELIVRPGDVVHFVVGSAEPLAAPILSITGLDQPEAVPPEVDVGAVMSWSWRVPDPSVDTVVAATVEPFVDAAENQTVLAPMMLRVDRSPPRLSLVNGPDGRIKRVAGAIIETATGVVEETVGLSMVRVFFRGREVGCVVTPRAGDDPSLSDFVCPVTIGDSDGDGVSVVPVVATDLAGNSSTSTVIVTLDGTAPRLLSATFASNQGAVRPESAVLLTLLADEPVSQAILTLGDRAGNSWNETLDIASAAPSSQLVTTLTAPLSGDLRLEAVTLVDEVGNRSTFSQSLVVTVDDEGPSIAPTVRSSNVNPTGATVGDEITIELKVASPLGSADDLPWHDAGPLPRGERQRQRGRGRAVHLGHPRRHRA